MLVGSTADFQIDAITVELGVPCQIEIAYFSSSAELLSLL
jgi:hypothetical protein